MILFSIFRFHLCLEALLEGQNQSANIQYLMYGTCVSVIQVTRILSFSYYEILLWPAHIVYTFSWFYIHHYYMYYGYHLNTHSTLPRAWINICFRKKYILGINLLTSQCCGDTKSGRLLVYFLLHSYHIRRIVITQATGSLNPIDASAHNINFHLVSL